MNGNEDFKAGENHGLLMGELQNIQSSLSDLKASFESYRVAMGPRLEEHGTKIVSLQEKVSIIQKIGGWIIAPAIGAITVALIKILLDRK